MLCSRNDAWKPKAPSLPWCVGVLAFEICRLVFNSTEISVNKYQHVFKKIEDKCRALEMLLWGGAVWKGGALGREPAWCSVSV